MYYFSAAVTWTVVHLARLHRTYLFVFSFAYNMFVLQTCWVSQCPSCTPAHFKLNHILRCKFVFSPLRLFRTRDPWFSLICKTWGWSCSLQWYSCGSLLPYLQGFIIHATVQLWNKNKTICLHFFFANVSFSSYFHSEKKEK